MPKGSKLRRVEHHAALPYDDLPEFLADLRGREGIPARALEFAILTGARTAEALGAIWGEINLAERTWIVPAERMKAGKEHRVPLSDAAVAVLESMLPLALMRDGAPDPLRQFSPASVERCRCRGWCC